MTTPDRLFELRSLMAASNVAACIIPGNDPHLSEYVADHWMFRKWISGFTGSAGTIVVTHEEAGLWTDSRYYLQADNELAETGISVFRTGEPNTPKPEEWLCQALEPGDNVGVDGRLFSVDEIRRYNKELKKGELKLDTNFYAADEIWTGRPPIPDNTIVEYALEYCGLSRTEKLKQIRESLKRFDASHYVVCALDEIAWTLNLRGKDVSYNPVFHSFLIISQSSAYLFIDPHKLTAVIGKNLAADNIKVSLYSDFQTHLKELGAGKSIRLFFDPQKTTFSALSSLGQKAEKVEGSSIITALKGSKNETEIKWMKNTMIKDGVAMVQFLHWLYSSLDKEKITELSAAAKAKQFRSLQEGFKGESFKTIAGYNANGAIVHYSATESSNATVAKNGFLLFDSGGQYLGGTTDLTRTIMLGEVSEQAKTDYTLVLKGHIGLAMARFPEGTKGVHLDAFARQALWNHGLNYGHGTGHGIGCYLNVHEGPQSIRPQDNGIEMRAGMITSNEPGLYRQGEYGIRIENLILTVASGETEYGKFMKFETLTLCPIDLKPVVKELLTKDETNWINGYHQTVFEKLNPHLDQDLKDFLKEITQPI
jgi:Xaa-Pro aminopeptidase